MPQYIRIDLNCKWGFGGMRKRPLREERKFGFLGGGEGGTEGEGKRSVGVQEGLLVVYFSLIRLLDQENFMIAGRWPVVTFGANSNDDFLIYQTPAPLAIFVSEYLKSHIICRWTPTVSLLPRKRNVLLSQYPTRETRKDHQCRTRTQGFPRW